MNMNEKQNIGSYQDWIRNELTLLFGLTSRTRPAE